MFNSLKMITDKVKQLYDQHNEILEYLFLHHWKDARPLEIEEKEGGIDLDFMIPPRPEEKKLSEKFKLDYQDWYSSSSALLERNYNKE
ncbi:MAG: hypothetical protein IMF19_08250, partial [Proteobacteria bacterium]|nr:hypothetical protein [Pseudomonadota bacterium]